VVYLSIEIPSKRENVKLIFWFSRLVKKFREGISERAAGRSY